ncbi:MAG: L-rhamnose isomerase [Spirochaetes bacterium]|nr:L-rhamnose isomerase [Spirochaetota bacterium]
MRISNDTVLDNYAKAKTIFSAYGVDADAALKKLAARSISLHCWQGDDVAGFEHAGALDGGIAATGNYPGKARNWDELKKDLTTALTLIPGSHRVNVHAIYSNGGKRTDRDTLTADDFRPWIDWAKEQNVKLDFNGSFFSHPNAADGRTLSHPDKRKRQFWIDHAIACRNIAETFGKELKSPSVLNLWIPDGSKDIPADRYSPRSILKDSLDTVYAKQMDTKYVKDAVECKLFGIGSESFVVGSHEFYMAYAMQKKLMLCFDMGHFHPTESVADKISSILLFMPELLLHVSRGVRWDSDHVVVLNDDVRALCEELERGKAWDRVHFALDYFDASINRLAAWVIGARASLKAMLIAMLEPSALIQNAETSGDYAERLALMEAAKTLPFGAVWDKYCLDQKTPLEHEWFDTVKKYEADVLSKRS